MSEAEESLPPRVITTKRGYTRTVTARTVSFRCEWCSRERTVLQYSGPLPRYCPECKHDAQNSLARTLMRRRRQQERDNNPFGIGKRPVGRPRKG